MAVGMSANAANYYALSPEEKKKRIQGSIPQTATPSTSTPITGMSANAVNTPSMPAYGANVQGFDAKNASHVQLADAGQQWATANAAGNTAGMSAAAALGNQIRSGVQGASYDSVKGVSTLPTVSMPKTPAISSTSSVSMPQGIMNVASAPDLQREAAANIDKQRVGLQQGVDKFIRGLKSGYDYSKQNTQDDRAIQDFETSQKVNPFSGRTSYERGLMGRQRTMEDAATDRQFNNELTAVQQQLLDFDRLAPEQQNALYQELKRMERTYGLDLAQISGDLPEGMGRTLAGQAQDYAQSPNNPQNVGQGIQNQLAQLQLENYPEQVKQQAQLFEQQLASGEMSQKAAEYNYQQLIDPNSATNQAKTLDLQMKELEAKNLPEKEKLELQKLRKQIADIGVVHYKPQTEAEKEYDKQQVVKIKAEIAKIKNEVPETPEDPPVKLDPKESTDNLSEAKVNLDGYSQTDARTYAQGIRDYLTDSDYKALIKFIEDEL